MPKIDEFLKRMKDSGASDLHLTVDSPPMLRVHGEMNPVSDRKVTQEINQSLLFEIMPPEIKKKYDTNKEVDFAYEILDLARFRVNVFTQRYGMGAVFRLIPNEILSLEKLGLPPVIESFAEKNRGLLLVTGATGSGKSTTLAALIDYINRSRKEHILTIEDPIEFVHPTKKCLINQREVGPHTHSFANALKSSLREDPDIILVGEMRDLETIELAITAAETGHLVYGTLHTSSASRTIERIINVFPPSQQEQIRMMVAESLLGVICQQLARRCDRPGRVAILEILVVHAAVSNLIREGKTFQIPSVIQTGRKYGMQTTDQALFDLYMKRVLSAEEAYLRATNKSQFEQFIAKKKMGGGQ